MTRNIDQNTLFAFEEEVLELLKEIQCVGYANLCPYCDAERPDYHLESCKLNNMIKRIEEEHGKKRS